MARLMSTSGLADAARIEKTSSGRFVVDRSTLAQSLAPYRRQGALAAATVQTVLAIADAAAAIAGLVASGNASTDLAGVTGAISDGDAQKNLDLIANRMILQALSRCPIGQVASEENEDILQLVPGGRIAVAIDPIDGSGNIASNAPIGTIFSIRPMTDTPEARLGAFASDGRSQLAAGFVLYGAQTTLMLTVGRGVDLFVLDQSQCLFMRLRSGLEIPEGTREYAINASNARHWDEPVRQFVADCIAGRAGPLGADYNTRWCAAMIAEAHRILLHGGVFLYPGDARPGYREGRLRLIYEAQPIAFLLEQAGGAATDGFRAISEIMPERLHQRVPLMFGARDEIARLTALHRQPAGHRDMAPLFGRRGLFRS